MTICSSSRDGIILTLKVSGGGLIICALDVQASTTTIKGISLETGVKKTKRFNDCPTASDIISWTQVNFPALRCCAYESGCTGFYLCRKLGDRGIACDFIAVSTIPKSTDDLQKTQGKHKGTKTQENTRGRRFCVMQNTRGRKTQGDGGFVLYTISSSSRIVSSGRRFGSRRLRRCFVCLSL